MALSTVLLGAATGAGGRERSAGVTRSVYVPVRIEACQHLKEGVLYQGDEPLGALPTERIFQFTFYPELGRVEPIRSRLRIAATTLLGERFRAGLVVTPWEIVTTDERRRLDLKAQLGRMRHQLDVRYPRQTLTLGCSRACRRRVASELPLPLGGLSTTPTP